MEGSKKVFWGLCVASEGLEQQGFVVHRAVENANDLDGLSGYTIEDRVISMDAAADSEGLMPLDQAKSFWIVF